MRKKKYMKTLGIGALSLLLGVSSLPATNYTNTVKAVEDTTIESPILGNTITWDCIYFGSYPQGEVTTTTDPNTYQILQSATNWNTDNTLTIDNITYKRLKKDHATSTGTSYQWNADTYHYFKFEPIKWRVIKVENQSAYMISDVALDTQKYNQEAREVSWDKSSLRSWLNGGNSSENQAKVDYSSNNFVDTAFSSQEQNALISTNNDKVTILSEEELKNNSIYGFDAPDNRTCKASTYTQAMGAHQDALGACNWWTSTNGNTNLTAKYIQQSGEVYTKGYSVAYAGNAVRAAVTINLTKTDIYQYAGTVSSDGTISETTPTTAPTSTPTATPSVTSATETEPPTFTTTPVTTFTVVPTQTIVATTATPTVAPTQTANTTTMTPTVIPTQKVTAATAAPTVVPTQVPNTTTTAPVQTPTSTTTDITKGSVWYHTASNAQYRVIKINNNVGTDGTIGTVAYLCPIKTTRTSATIPAKVTIENHTFKVTTIANGAFAGNKKLKKVVIGKNITKINANAFKGCKKLSKITIRTTGLTKKSIGKNAFKKINAKATIKVPSIKLKKYKKFIKAAGAAKTVVFKRIK